MGEIYTTLRDRLEREQGSAMATVVLGEQYLGAKLLVLPHSVHQGSLGHPELDAQVLPDAEQAIWDGTAQIYTYVIEEPHRSPQSYAVFIEGFPPPPSLIIVGAGHIAIPLTTFAKTLNYHVTVIDARSAFATRERFPHADEIIVAWPDEVLAKMELSPAVAVVVLTHDPKFDEPTLKVVLSQAVGYVGAIGSRKTSEERAERLVREGLTQEQLERIHGPIGLNIGAISPEEIALAIMAEITAIRRRR